jgi:hypothetical protein
VAWRGSGRGEAGFEVLPDSVLELLGAQAVPAAGGGGGGLPRLGIEGRCARLCGRELLEELLCTAPERFGERPLLLSGDAFEGTVKVVRKLNLSFDHDGELMEVSI